MEDKEDVVSRMFKPTLHHITDQIVHRFVQIQDKNNSLRSRIKNDVRFYK